MLVGPIVAAAGRICRVSWYAAIHRRSIWRSRESYLGMPKTGGRKKGTPNKVTLQAREAAAEIIDDPEYRANLKARAIAGDLAPGLEQMLWAHAKGAPPTRVEVGTPGDFSQMSDAELRAELEAILGRG